MSASTFDLDELLAGVDELLEAHEGEREDDPGEGNFRCEGCNACYNCRFCEGCDSCEDCTYCEDCVDSVTLTQSKRCVSSSKSSYLEDCRGCEGSRYLALCVDCKDCLHCLACVGLEGVEYHVLNEKVSKKEFYKMLNRMREDLDSRVDQGWRPEVIGLVAVLADEEEEQEELEHDEEADAFMRRPKPKEPQAGQEFEDSEIWKSPTPQAPASESVSPKIGVDTGVLFNNKRDRSPPRNDSDVWDDPPRPTGAPKRGGALSRGRRPALAGEPSSARRDERAAARKTPSRPAPSSLRDESFSEGETPPRSSSPQAPAKSSPRESGEGSSSMTGSALFGRRPARRTRPQGSSRGPMGGQGGDPEGKPDPFGEDSMRLGELMPSRPKTSQAPDELPSGPKKGRGGLKRGRRPPRNG